MPFFVSRGDETYISEISIWNLNKASKPNPSIDKWYLETGQGMGVPNIAVAMNAYTYSDRATWLKFKNKQNHKVLFDNDKIMRNQYGIVLI